MHPKRRRTNSEVDVKRLEAARKKQMRPGQPPEPHRSWISPSCLPAARSERDDGTGPTALTKSATFTSTGCRSRDSEESRLCNLCVGQRPIPLQERTVEEAAMPGQPVTHSRAFPISPGNSPSRIASCHQRHRTSSLGKPSRSHVFAEPTLGQIVAHRNRKTFRSCAETVDDRTFLWKPEEKCARTAATALGQNL